MPNTTENKSHLAGSPQPLVPTTREPSPVNLRVNNQVLDATFVTHAIPDISPNTGVIGLCTVPRERAGMNDLGWHIADYLAFKALLAGETHAKAQTWLALCDVAAIVNANPKQYVHGKDHRLVGKAAAASSFTDRRGNIQHRDDQIKVETSVENLKSEFHKALSVKSDSARKMGCPLVIIVCGPTTLEQDVFFGKADAGHCSTRNFIRHALGSDIDVIMITPALFSSGWQVDPFFCRPPARKVRADRTEFLAKQFGGVFADDIIETFLGWACPLLDLEQVDKEEKDSRFPGPAMPSHKQKEAIDTLRVEIHKVLASRSSTGHGDHSFIFEVQKDDWEILVGPRQYRPLSYYQQKWSKLEVASTATSDEQGLGFLGNAFGGNQTSQVNHIKQLVRESFESWPGYWKLPFGRGAKAAFNAFLDKAVPECRDCHEIFNIMEHRAATAVLADMTVRYFDLPVLYKQRCKDWDEPRWIGEVSDHIHLVTNQPFGEMSRCIPSVTLPPEVNRNRFSMIQSRLEVPASYLSASLCTHYHGRVGNLQGALRVTAKRISSFFDEIRARQLKQLLEDPEVENKCITWLRSIHMPVRNLNDALAELMALGEQARAAYVGNSPSEKPMEESAKKIPTAIPLIEQPAAASPSTPHEAQTEPGDSFTILPPEAIKMISQIDPQAAIEEVHRMRENLVCALADTPPDGVPVIQAKLVETQRLLETLDDQKHNKGQVKNGINEGAKQGNGLESTPTRQGSSNGTDNRKDIAQSQYGQSIPNAANYIPPHLRRVSQGAREENKSDTPSLRASSPLAQTIHGQSREPLQSTSRTSQEEVQVKKAPKQYVPPHLRHLVSAKNTGN